MGRIWLGSNGDRGARDPHQGDVDPTRYFDELPAGERAAEARRTREAFAARLEQHPDDEPPHWPARLDGVPLEDGALGEGWFIAKLTPSSAPALERLTRGVMAAVAERAENHRRFLRAEPGYFRFALHPAQPLDEEFRRAGLVAPLLLNTPPRPAAEAA
jgi:hypothetical protein